MWQRLLRILADLIIAPLIVAIVDRVSVRLREHGYDGLFSKFDMEDEIRALLEKFTKEQLKALLNDEIVQQFYSLQSEVELLRAQLQALNNEHSNTTQGLAKNKLEIQRLFQQSLALYQEQKKIKATTRLDDPIGRSPGGPSEASTGEVSFG